MKHPVPPVSPKAADTARERGHGDGGHHANVKRAIGHVEEHATTANHATGEDAGFPHMGEGHPPGDSY